MGPAGAVEIIFKGKFKGKEEMDAPNVAQAYALAAASLIQKQ
jgi:hypothetical protein